MRTTYMPVCVIIPVFNEAENIAKVIAAIPSFVAEVIVVDNGSTDNSSAVAKAAGATVLHEAVMGYGMACLKGITYLKGKYSASTPLIVAFLDGDFSDYPEQLPLLTKPINTGKADFVVGSRVALSERGSLTFPQRMGNMLACRLLRIKYANSPFTDLGPFRAIKWSVLLDLNMQDRAFGWTVEMQAKALKKGFSCQEVDVKYRTRYRGKSKVSGNIKGAFLAGVTIIKVIAKT